MYLCLLVLSLVLIKSYKVLIKLEYFQPDRIWNRLRDEPLGMPVEDYFE